MHGKMLRESFLRRCLHALLTATGAAAIALFLSGNVCRAADPPPAVPAAPPAKGEKIRLFGTVELKNDKGPLPGWARVIRENKAHPSFSPGKMIARNIRWDDFKAKAGGKSGLELLRYVHRFWNSRPYIEDIANWGQRDYWEFPCEFIKKSGDCEDYAIAKYFTLKELGIPAETMRIVVVRIGARNDEAHAVLVVYMGGDAYVLDNLSPDVLSHTARIFRSYVPHFSINETGRWVHFKTRDSKKK